MLVTDSTGYRFYRKTNKRPDTAYGYVVSPQGLVYVYATTEPYPFRMPGEQSRVYRITQHLLDDGFIEVASDDFPAALVGGCLPLPPLEIR